MNSTTLRVAIIGGGIGGTAAANALLQRGIDVHVYEQAPQLGEVGAGVALTPNGLRTLRRLGMGTDVSRLGSRWVDAQFRHADGTFVAPMFASDTAGSIEYHGMHRADLLDIFVSKLPGDVVIPGHQCIGFTQNAEHATVSFANGEQISADVVVGADGMHSTLQQYVVAPAAPLHSGSSAYRGLITADSVSWPAGAVRLWMGEGKHFLVYPVRTNQLLNYVGFVPASKQMKESWSAPGDPRELAREFAGWDPMVEAIIAQVNETFQWGLYDREPLPTWTKGRLTLLGDAAHPMLPHAGQGANQAIEDGLALATILHHVDSANVPRALLAYEALRRERTSQVQRRARESGARYDAPAQHAAARDQELTTRHQDRAWLFDYDAEAAAAAVATTL